MPAKIKKIEIRAFRGIPEVELELEGKSLLVRGENGTGKSSIVDAVEFFFTGKVSHLEGVRGLSLQRHGPHRNFKPEDINISITFDPGEVHRERTLASVPSVPRELQDYFAVTQKGTFILRRSQLLNFIMSQPADRFRAIGSIIGVEPLDNTELEMMRLRDDLEGQVRSKQSRVDSLFQEVSATLGKMTTRVDEIVPKLNEKLVELNLPPIKSLEEAGKHAEEMLSIVKKKVDSSNEAKLLNEIVDAAKTPLITDEFINQLDELNERIRPLLPEEAKKSLSLMELLETGRRVMAQKRMARCPLCEQVVEPDRLLSNIDQRLKTLRELSQKASEIRKISVSLIDILRNMVNRLIFIIPKIGQFAELLEASAKLKERVDFLNDYADKVISAKDLNNEIPIQDIIEHKDKMAKIIDGVSSKSNQLLENIGLTGDEKKVLEAVRLIEQVKSKAHEIVTVESGLNHSKASSLIAHKIYITFSDAKKGKIQEVYDSIQVDLQKFFSMLHPYDPHKNIELTVALGRRASTELKIESFGRRGEDPRALTSEGHLDSLGLCIFLAFVKRFNQACPLIILDDVVTTIDSNHRKKIAQLLMTEFAGNQLLITTHDGIWYEQLIGTQKAYGHQGNFKNVEIIDWEKDRGPRMAPYKPRWEKIQDKLNSGDKTGAGNDGRTYLEATLKEICENMLVPVAFRSLGKYEVKELFDPAEKRIKGLLKDSEFKTTVLSKFQELRLTMFMGNLLSHDNIQIEEVSLEEVKSFCSAVHNLYRAFLCPDCGFFVSYFRDLKIVRCSNPRCVSPLEVKTK